MYYRFRRAEQKSVYDLLPVGFPIPSTYPYQIRYKTNDGGTSEIRTHGAVTPSGLANLRDRPLCHSSFVDLV